ncbi:MAG: hypothetical protein ACPGO3_14910 [Magnetospiraceae bacterium]
MKAAFGVLLLCLGLAACAGPGGSKAPVTPVSVTPESLIGKSDRDVLADYGPPPFKRTDGPAEIWQYRSDRCTLDLFFYTEGGRKRVSHQELRYPGGSRDRPACLTALGTAIAERAAASS